MAEFDDDYQIELYSRVEALAVARTEALRNLHEGESLISYVAYDPVFHDYCHCEFALQEGGWVKVLRSLTGSERLPGEEIGDETIRALAADGKMVIAVRLYRTKYGVGLSEAVEALKSGV